MSNQSLYTNPSLYEKVFSLDQQDIRFFQSLSYRGFLLDLGCGDAQLAQELDGIGLDLELSMIQDAACPVVAADIMQLPMLDHSVSSLICRLFGVSYAIGAQYKQAEKAVKQLASEFKRIRALPSVVILEIPLAWTPGSLCGIEETVDISPTLTYSFRYLDVMEKTSYGAVLDSLISVQSADGMKHDIHQPLHVFTPDGARKWLKQMGCNDICFYASYDLETKTKKPPDDCLRGVLVGQ